MRIMPAPPGCGAAARRPREAAPPAGAEQQRQLWLLQDGQPRAVSVRTGISDGRRTEISSPELQPGMAVITDQRAAP